MKDVIQKIISGVQSALSLDLKQERVSQFNKDPNSKYACFFTSFFMYFRTVYSTFKMTWSEYQAACIRIGAINLTFTVLDHSKMAAAAGFPGLKCFRTSSRIKEKILELLILKKPVPFSLAGRHYESIDGYEIINGKLRFKVDDPGGQKDTFCDADTLEVYREENGIQIFSIHPDGSRRKITTVYWFE